MPHTFEQIPVTSDNCHFPGGDIDERQEMAGMQLYYQLTTGDEDNQIACLTNLRRGEIGEWRTIQQQEPLSQSIKTIAQKWGHTFLGDIEYSPGDEDILIGQGNRIVALGTFGMLAFIRKSHLLPTKFSPYLAEELLQMAQFSPDRIHLLADNSWAQMQESHERLYQITKPLVQHFVTLFHLRDDELVLLDAATALPYLLATTSRIDNYMTRAIGDSNVDRTIHRARKTLLK